MLNQALIDCLVMQSVVQLLNDGFDDENVGSLIMSSDIIDFTGLSAVCHHIYSLAVILDIKPVSDLHAVSVYRKLLMMSDIVDHERNKLLRELIWTIVIGAACYIHRHAVGIMERFDK